MNTMTATPSDRESAEGKGASDQPAGEQQIDQSDPGYLDELADEVVPETRDEVEVLKKRKP